MSADPGIPRRDLERLLGELEDGLISSDDHARLMDLMRRSPAVRAGYLDHMGQSSALHEVARGWGGMHEREIRTRQPRPGRLLLRSTLAAAALLALLAVVGSFIFPAARVPDEVVAGPDTEWRFSSGGLDEHGMLLENSRFVLSKGSLRIRTGSGTQMLVEGPADFSLIHRLNGELRHGQAWFDVADGDEGFTVTMPRLKARDLGTRFGLIAGAEIGQVHVAEGEVEVSSSFGSMPVRSLRAGQAVAADEVGRMSDIDFEGHGFLKELPTAPPSWHWSFDDVSGFEDRYRIATADDPRLVEGRFGRAWDLTSGGGISDFPGIEGKAPRTISVWLRGRPAPPATDAAGRNVQATLVGWGRYSFDGTKWELAVSPDGSAFGIQWGGSWVLAEGGALLNGSWRHLVAVYDGNEDAGGRPRIRLYLDAEPLPITKVHVEGPVNTQTGSARRMMVGCHDWPGYPERELPWLLDELWVVKSALGEQQIRMLHEENRLSFSGEE